jgi:hypothetical protein
VDEVPQPVNQVADDDSRMPVEPTEVPVKRNGKENDDKKKEKSPVKNRKERAKLNVQVCYESLASPVVCLHDTIVA